MGAKVRVLIVDDSAFFRNRVAAALQTASDIEVVGFAANGAEAIRQNRSLKPDVVTMDVEMPVIDGITAVRKIMAEMPTRILMFSAVTTEGARETLDALDAGAMDFLPKEMNNPVSGAEETAKELLERVRNLGKSSMSRSRSSVKDYLSQSSRVSPIKQTAPSFTSNPELVAIGASTGGPVALRQILSALPRNFPLPVVAAVHMPGSFTTAYAERLDVACSIKVKEAVDRDRLVPGEGLIAPGGKQLRIVRGAGGYQIRISEALPGEIYHPSVDVFLSSVAESYRGNALGLILTGMGADGLEGAKKLKNTGASLWSQDEKSCVVYGMPQAVEKAGLSDRVLGLDEMGPLLARLK
ncbi:MAG: chemotaxis response regulator protein-glutamate methylesterase [Candidatus Thiodiazotropha sp. 6PLUC2]